ncbi:MAG: ATP-dependent helicase [archaeon]
MITFKKKPNSDEELFGLLHPIVKTWFQQKFGSFSNSQKMGVMNIHSRKNTLISAPTGSGKTLTAALAILNELVDSSEKGILEDRVYCIYTNPLKALSNDVEINLRGPLREMESLAMKDLGIRVAVRTGDTSAAEKAFMLEHPPHILVCTPENLAIMLSSLRFREHLKKVEWLILDEIHALADNKRGTHLSLSLERLQHLSPALCRVGLSATVAPLGDVARFLVGNDRKCTVIDAQSIKKFDLKVLSPVPDLVNVSYDHLNKKLYQLLDKLIQEHKTTLIFTNTRAGTERVVHHLKTHFPKSYYEIDEENPKKVSALIGAHHGSLSKQHRLKIEDSLRKGKLKCVVCSTSLELGLDIGYIDLVICLGSPKSVARFLQRTGRSGHKLHDTVKGRMIVMDRDDLVECSVLLKNAVEKKIDRISIPNNCLDVLAQQLVGMCIDQKWAVKSLYSTIKKCYPYRDLTLKDFDDTLSYLAGEFTSLEDRHIYAKIWYDREAQEVGKKGRMTRVIYMTNIGTIPSTDSVLVKMGESVIGSIDEAFLEKLSLGDRFVLGGDCYQFRHSRGMVAQVVPAYGSKPTVPSWVSESLPLSFDLANSIQSFRGLINEKFERKQSRKDIIEFINAYLYVDTNASEAIYNYFYEQFHFTKVPHNDQILIENYTDEDGRHYSFFHTLCGRRVNDVLSRAVALAIARSQHHDAEVGITDNGFYVACTKKFRALPALKLLKSSELQDIIKIAIRDSEVLKRRFRHCAGRSLMILRNYKGNTKRAGRQQVSSMILLNAIRRISEEFTILKEAKREVLEDLMDINNSVEILRRIESKKIRLIETNTKLPSPFAFNLLAHGHSDVYKMEDRIEFLRKMHQLVLAKISLEQGKASRR